MGSTARGSRDPAVEGSSDAISSGGIDKLMRGESNGERGGGKDEHMYIRSIFSVRE